MIVVGRRGKLLFERWLIGSVAKKVMSYAPCGMLIVRSFRPRGEETHEQAHRGIEALEIFDPHGGLRGVIPAEQSYPKE